MRPNGAHAVQMLLSSWRACKGRGEHEPWRIICRKTMAWEKIHRIAKQKDLHRRVESQSPDLEPSVAELENCCSHQISPDRDRSVSLRKNWVQMWSLTETYPHWLRLQPKVSLLNTDLNIYAVTFLPCRCLGIVALEKYENAWCLRSPCAALMALRPQ